MSHVRHKLVQYENAKSVVQKKSAGKQIGAHTHTHTHRHTAIHCTFAAS